MTYMVLSPPDRDAISPGDLEARVEEGSLAFAKWFTRVMDDNGWSHPQMVSLCKAVTADKAFLHSSQIAGLRAARLKSPGPRSFVALEFLWYGIERYQQHLEGQFGRLAPLVESASIMRDPNGKPASTGYMLEVFSGLRPAPIDLTTTFYTDREAKVLSNNAARLVRRLMVVADLDPIFDLEVIVSRFPGDIEDKNKFKALLMGQQVWGGEDVDAQIASLSKLLREKFKFERNPKELLEELKK